MLALPVHIEAGEVRACGADGARAIDPRDAVDPVATGHGEQGAGRGAHDQVAIRSAAQHMASIGAHREREQTGLVQRHARERPTVAPVEVQHAAIVETEDERGGRLGDRDRLCVEHRVPALHDHRVLSSAPEQRPLLALEMHIGARPRAADRQEAKRA